jgi:HlyD family secretion protein
MPTTTRRRRILFWGTITLVIAAALAVVLRPQPVPVDLAGVVRGPLLVTLDHEGRTRVHDRYVVSAPVGGRVQRIELRPGDRVTAGRTVIATFLPTASPLLDARTRAEARSRLSSAEASWQQARAQRELARVQSEHAAQEGERARNLAQLGLVTAEARQAAEAEAAARGRALEAAEAAVNAAAHDVEAARAALLEPGSTAARDVGGQAVITLTSPIDGVVLNRLRESEAVVPQGEPLVEIGNMSDLEVVADYLSTDAVKMRPGMRALVDQWGGDKPLDGSVRRVEPAGFMKVSALGVEEQRVWVVIQFADPAAVGRLLADGYRVEARIVAWERADAVKVPTSSLFRRGDGWAVYVFDGGVARLRAVTVGHQTGTEAEVLSGVVPGERVVLYPPDSVTDGVKVMAR